VLVAPSPVRVSSELAPVLRLFSADPSATGALSVAGVIAGAPARSVGSLMMLERAAPKGAGFAQGIVEADGLGLAARGLRLPTTCQAAGSEWLWVGEGVALTNALLWRL